MCVCVCVCVCVLKDYFSLDGRHRSKLVVQSVPTKKTSVVSEEIDSGREEAGEKEEEGIVGDNEGEKGQGELKREEQSELGGKDEIDSTDLVLPLVSPFHSVSYSYCPVYGWCPN